MAHVTRPTLRRRTRPTTSRSPDRPFERGRIPRILARFSPARGAYRALGSYLVTGAVLMAFLSATIHQRSVAEIQNYPSFQRYHQIIQVWIEHGYFTHGGLAFKEPASANPTQMVWRSNSLAFLQVAHLLQRINYALTGRSLQIDDGS